jgi:type IV pilus assembly protein PilV
MAKTVLPKILLNNAGFSMIEVLITILVFAIGLLGVAAMQVQSLKGTADSGQRGKAVWLAQELTERMRANPTGVENGDYNNKADCGAAPAKMCSNYYDGSSSQSAVSCKSDEMAAFDLWELACGTYNPSDNGGRKGNTVNFLAGADITVLCSTCADPVKPAPPIENADFTITVSWTGRGGSADGLDSEQKVELLVRP